MTAPAFDIDEIMREVFASARAAPPAKVANLLNNPPEISRLAELAAPPASNTGATIIDIAAHLDRAQRIADAKNNEAAMRGETDRFCKCGDYANRAWRIAGREVWRCERCEGT
jgi:hypothetical protein